MGDNELLLTNQTRTLGILDCDDIAEPLRADYVNYGSMFDRLLSPFAKGWHIKNFRIIEDVWPEEPKTCDAYLITGSKTGVYDNVSWIAPLASFVQTAYAHSIPLVGICFGHQFLANNLGGKAEKSTRGWGIGNRLVHAEHTPKWMNPNVGKLNLLYSHQDQVTALPPTAQRLFGDVFCPNAAFLIPNHVLTFQGHPEFTEDYIARLMDLRQEHYAPGQYELALASLEKSHDGSLVARWIFQFLAQASDTKGVRP